MQPVREIVARAVPLDRTDVDTDQIIPSDWLKRVERTGFGEGLFSEWRESSDFVLNQDQFDGAQILVAGPNFGTRLVARARAVGARGLRLPRRHLAPLRRHLPQQLPEDRARCRSSSRPRWSRGSCGRVEDDPTIEIVIDVVDRRVAVPAMDLDEPFDLDRLPPLPPARRPRRHRPHPPPHHEIDAFEAQRPTYTPPSPRLNPSATSPLPGCVTRAHQLCPSADLRREACHTPVVDVAGMDWTTTPHLPADRAIADIANGSTALVTLAQLDDLGVTRRQRQWRLATGRWESPYTGVYRIGGLPHSWRSDLLAACLAGPAVASHRSAAALWDLPGLRRDHVERSRAAWRSARNMRADRARIAVARGLRPGRRRQRSDDDDRADPVRPRSVVSRGRRRHGNRSRRFGRELIDHGRLVATQSRLATAKGAGDAAMFHRIMARRSDGRAYPESAPGTAARSSSRRSGPARTRSAVRRRATPTDGWWRACDLAYPDWRVVIEYDSVQVAHRQRGRRPRQRTPERDLRARASPHHCDRRRSALSRRPCGICDPADAGRAG